MKTRDGFVANSSSSSFLIRYPFVKRTVALLSTGELEYVVMVERAKAYARLSRQDKVDVSNLFHHIDWEIRQLENGDLYGIYSRNYDDACRKLMKLLLIRDREIEWKGEPEDDEDA
jgi:hypothetical protein